MTSPIFFIVAGVGPRGLDLVLLQTVLPHGGEGGNTILTEVNQNVPRPSG